MKIAMIGAALGSGLGSVFSGFLFFDGSLRLASVLLGVVVLLAGIFLLWRWFLRGVRFY